MKISDIVIVPGWSKIQQYATDTYGDGGVNIVLNPPEVCQPQSLALNFAHLFLKYLNAPATVCMQDGPIPVQLQGKNRMSSGDIA